jgi:RNA polymerase sigma-70 factor (ECF subfamily)
MVGEAEAEDLMQEVFIKVSNSLDTFKGDSQISTWIYRIAANTALDKLKSAGYKRDKFKTTSLDYIQPLKNNRKSNHDEEYDIEYNFFKQEMNQCISDFINRLPDNYRMIFLLHEYDNFTFDEIAEITGISFDNVKIRLHRARKKLHDLLISNCTFYYDEYSKLCCDKK